MPEFINTADVIGDDEMCDQIITRTVTEYKEDRITQVGDYAFYGCSQLEYVELPNVTSIGGYSFRGASGVSTLKNAIVILPSLKSVPSYVFVQSGIKILDLRDVTTIGTNLFENTWSFIALIIRNETVIPTVGATLFHNRYGDDPVYVYVPAALIDSYKSATNWSAHADKFRAIEDYLADSISLNASELTFTTGNSQTLVATVVPEKIAVTWQSSNKTVAKVDENGVVTPVADGVAIITASSPLGERTVQCKVVVNAGLNSYGILKGIQFNKGYLTNGSPAGTGTDSDVHTDRFNVTSLAGESIVVTLFDVKITGANSRICYYNSSGTYISQVNGVTSGSDVKITSTVPTNAAFAAISIARSNGFSGMEITCDDELIGTIPYEGVKTT